VVVQHLVSTTRGSDARRKTMGYVRGDTVVHPQHGAAIVTAVIQKDVGSGPTDYLELFVEEGSLTISVPAGAVAQVGIRDVSTRKEAEAVLRVLDGDADVRDRWSERNAVTVGRMKSADLSSFAMVVRDLTHHAHRTGKPLSSYEKNARDTCVDLLARELSLSLKLSQEETTALIFERVTASVPDAASQASGPAT
jgi:CarD family transcriptional regulator